MNSNNLLDYSLNYLEMMDLNPDAKIMLYTELNNINDVNELFIDCDKVIILYLIASSNSGHWVCIFKCKDIIEFFSSYGVPPDAELSLLTSKKRAELNEKQDRLLLLCKKYKNLIFWNKTIYQAENTQTCGCFVTHRLHNNKLNDIEYYNLYIKNKIKNPDIYVAKYCLKKLNKLN